MRTSTEKALDRVRAIVEEEIDAIREQWAQEEVDSVRCYVCNLRYGDRRDYPCRIEGTAHEYSQIDLDEARTRFADTEVSHVALDVADLLAALKVEE